RHTRFSRDWSSDVCSSDLTDPVGVVDLLLATTWGAEAARALRDDTAQERTGALTRLAALREAAVEEVARALGGTDRHPEPERPRSEERSVGTEYRKKSSRP